MTGPALPSAAERIPPASAGERCTSEPRPATARLDGAGFSDRGRTWSANEDCYRIDPEIGLLVIADGMGGHSGGDVASQMAADAVVDCLRQAPGRVEPQGEAWPFGFDDGLSTAGNRLRTAFQLAHLRLLDAALFDPSLTGMGTTLVAALVENGRLVVAWAGDSRLYVTDREGVRQVTEDDSWMAATLRSDPDADVEVLQRHPLRHALTNVVGTTSRTEVHVVEVASTPGMVVALTTDGVHGSLRNRDIAHLLSSRPCPAHAAADLVAAAMGAGSTDNCTAIVARLSPVEVF